MEKSKLTIKEIGPKRLVMLFLAGVLLVAASVPNLFSSNNTEKEPIENGESVNNTATKTDVEDTYASYYENKLKKLLQKVQGIGNVEIMITLKSSKEQVVLKDTPYQQESLNETDSGGGTRISSNVASEESTVMVKNKSGEDVPYVTKEIEAQIAGVVVLAEGGGSGSIAADIVEAVEVLFGVPAHKVKVLPLK